MNKILENRKFINPLDIKEEDLPVFVLADDLNSFIGWAIRHITGNYNHAMIMVHPKKIATQGFVYKEIPVTQYMISSQMLKFWRYRNIIPAEILSIRKRVEAKLARPWYERCYDYLGIVGQFFKVSWLNNPWKTYCSEDVAQCVRMIQPLKDKMPAHPSPAKLNDIFNTIPEMEVLGYYLKEGE